MPGTHQKFLSYFIKQQEPTHLKVLDLGAGHGAFTKKLHEMGYGVEACDLFPELFYYKDVKCKKVDITRAFPYADNYFDLVIAIEVSEHIADHENFFAEINRILKPAGKLYLSTPNMLSLKSRLKFLLGGFFHSFDKLELRNYDGLQHIASRTLDQYNYIALKHGFNTAEVSIDRKQSTSQWLYIMLLPLIMLYEFLKKPDKLHNQRKLLLGRLLFLCFRKAQSK